MGRKNRGNSKFWSDKKFFHLGIDEWTGATLSVILPVSTEQSDEDSDTYIEFLPEIVLNYAAKY